MRIKLEKLFLRQLLTVLSFFIKVWLPFKITLVVPDSQILLLLHQPSVIYLKPVHQQTKRRAQHQECKGRSMQVTGNSANPEKANLQEKLPNRTKMHHRLKSFFCVSK